ncbi:TPM domain-containing protein [Sphingomonas sp. GlSt437]|uniref:TPM domain-containing protein n=1 Tax=Sphingomonas sp. GlSt437 TaxID=3389970 RepID=UPI003EB6E79C
MLFASTLHAQTFPPLSGRVVDAAHVLNDAQVAQLAALSSEVEQASSRQLVVATIPDLQGNEIEDYGYKLGRAWGIGQKGANNGIILIVAPKEHKVRIEVGYGLEPIMTDALSNQIISEAIVPRFKAGDMPGGIIAGAQAIADQLKAPPEAAEQKALAAGKARRHHGDNPAGAIVVLVIMILLFVVLPMIFRRAGGRRYYGGGGIPPVILWGGGGGSGWGSGGGSDWGGGGGGGFSGGGGSFGGGGASGSW